MVRVGTSLIVQINQTTLIAHIGDTSEESSELVIGGLIY